MTGQQGLLDELEDALGRHDIGRRAEILRRVADLFVATSSRCSDEQIALFDDVMSRLVEEIDISAKVVFGQWLAVNPDAPPNFMRALAIPKTAEPWSLTSLREKLIKIGAKVVSHGRYVTFQMAEVAVPRQMFADILSLIAQLRAPPAPA